MELKVYALELKVPSAWNSCCIKALTSEASDAARDSVTDKFENKLSCRREKSGGV